MDQPNFDASIEMEAFRESLLFLFVFFFEAGRRSIEAAFDRPRIRLFTSYAHVAGCIEAGNEVVSDGGALEVRMRIWLILGHL